MLLSLAIIFLIASPSSNAYMDPNSLYVESYISFNEKINVNTTAHIKLRDINTSQTIATCYTFSTGGYAIVDTPNNRIYEYSLTNSSPYFGQKGNCYYGGPFNYFIKSGSNFIHTLDHSEVSESELIKKVAKFTQYRASSKNSKSISEKLKELDSAKKSFSITSSASQRDLYGSLSTAWVSSYCGPTSAYIVLEYMGKLRANHSDPEGEIIYISGFTGKGVNLDSLRNGITNYLSTHSLSGTAYSCSYSFNTVKSKINVNTPITLGTDGHVQTIHGYRLETISVNNKIYTLYTNDSWGSNDVAITYEINPDTPYPPSYLNDHVYID